MNKRTRKPHAKDLRKGRYSSVNQIYLITTVIHKRQPLFLHWHLARILINVMRKHHQNGRVESLAFVVMPDHLHWLLVLQDDLTLSELIRRVKGSSSRFMRMFCEKNDIALDSGAVWQDGFYDRALRKDEDCREAARYIVANPLRAGLVDKIGDYPWWDAKWL